jgi:hypothetical protein
MNDFEKERNINQSICNLLLERDKYKELYEEALEVCQNINNKLYSIGAPLNDNCLKFNKQQLVFLHSIAQEIKNIIC